MPDIIIECITEMGYYKQRSFSNNLLNKYRAYLARIPRWYDRLFFKLSYFHNHLRASMNKWDKYHEIHPGLYLSRLPDETMKSDIFRLFQGVDGSPKGLIVACTEYFEFTGAYQFIQPSAYEEQGIKHHFLPIPDFTASINDRLVIDTLSIMRQFHQQGKPIVVHCKAGRGRSAMILALHLIQIDPSLHVIGNDGQLNARETLLNTQKKCRAIRANFYLNQPKMLKAEHILRRYFVQGTEEKQHNSSYGSIAEAVLPQTVTTAFDYLHSELFINALLQSNEYKKLMIHIAENESENAIFYRVIKTFFQQIMQGDLTWYKNLHELQQGTTIEDRLRRFSSQRLWDNSVFNSSVEQNRLCYRLIFGLKRRVDRLLNDRFKDHKGDALAKKITSARQVRRQRSLALQDVLDRDRGNPLLTTAFSVSLLIGAGVFAGAFFLPVLPLTIPVVIGMMGLFIMAYSTIGIVAINAISSHIDLADGDNYQQEAGILSPCIGRKLAPVSEQPSLESSYNEQSKSNVPMPAEKTRRMSYSC